MSGRMMFLLVLVIACAVSSVVGYDKAHIPGKVMSWTYDGTNAKANSYQMNTQTLEFPSAVDQMRASMTKSPEVLALLRFKDDQQITTLSRELPPASKSTTYNSVYRTVDTSLTVNPAFNHISNSEMFAGAKELSVEEFRNHLIDSSSASHPLSNQQVDRFVVTIDPTRKNVEKTMLEDITKLANVNSPVTFVAVNEPAEHTLLPAEVSSYKRLLSTDTLDGANYLPEGSEYSIYYQAQYLYITPDLFTGLLTMLFIAFVMMTGLSCLGAIQGPSTFASKNPIVGKEA